MNTENQTAPPPTSDPAVASSALLGDRYWYCIIGPVPRSALLAGADFPPRMAARQAVLDNTGFDPKCRSGWIDKAEYERMLKAQFVDSPNDPAQAQPAAGVRPANRGV